MRRLHIRFGTVLIAMLGINLAVLAHAQTYHVGDSSPEAPKSGSENPKNGQPTANSQKPLGWGSNIQNARLARAAEMALTDGNYTAATDYAQRAAESASGDPQLWFLLGYAARLAGRITLSADAYSRGLKLDPSSLDGQSGLAQTYAKAGKRDESIAILKHIVEVAPRRADDSALLGEIFLESGRYDDAVAVLQRTEQAAPSARSELLLALCYERLKQPEKANRELELAKAKAPDNPEVQRALAGFYRGNGNYSAAIQELQGIARKTPDLMAELAYTYQLDGKKDEAARLYSQAANAAPRDTALQLSAAQAEVNVGDVDSADRLLNRAATADPENYRVHAIRGQIANLRENPDDALREFAAALDHLPQSPPEGPLYGIELRMSLVDLLRSQQGEAAAQQQLALAHSQIRQMDEQGPDRQEFLRLRARIRMNQGDLAGAQSDAKEALAVNANDLSTLQLAGDVLAKAGHPDEAIADYNKILGIDSSNRLALTALGYVAREAGDDQKAEQYFQRLAEVDPKSYLPYLAMGDMYTARRDYAKAESYYRKSYDRAPHNSLIVAGGMNAAIEDHHYPLAAEWLQRATPAMQQEPHVMREKERYLSWTGDYKASAEVGREAIKKLPSDHDVVVYLGYDLLHLEQYDELLQLTNQYRNLLPKEPDIPLLAGYVHKHDNQPSEAKEDFTQTLQRDPKVATAYINRGYVENDLRQAEAAAADFREGLRLEPNNAEAHLGLAYSSLALHQPRQALRQAQLAEAQFGQTQALHVIRATAYSETGAWTKAVDEYQAAIKFAPNEPGLHAALAGTLYALRRYQDSVAELQLADKLSPGESAIHSQIARSFAQLHDRDQAMHYVELAEKDTTPADPEKVSMVLVTDGEALTLLGETNAAMQRFAKALGMPEGDRLGVRLAVAHLMVAKGDEDGARRQIALGLMEAQVGDSPAPTGENFLQVGDVFLGTHDYKLAQKYFEQALATGAPETPVRIGLANSYLAEGDTVRANAQLTLISSDANASAQTEPSYQLMLAKAAVLRQEHQNVQALTAFAQAADASGEDDTADRQLLEAGRDEGLRINRHLSFLSTFSVAPIFEDTTVYPLDAKLDVTNPIPGRQGLLPLPRSSLETQWTDAYHLHLAKLPDITGFFQMRNARGQISLPSSNSIVNRDTTDYSFNIGINPTVRLGNNVFTFNGGIQETLRRDSKDPIDMDQNLFRQFVYMSTSSFFNIISIDGYATHESGPFTLSTLRSRDLAGALDFRVGRPWGKTALVTGMGARDEQFFPVIREFFFTSTYAGLEHQFGTRLRVRAVAEHLRSWRVELNQYAPAQAIRPAGNVQFLATRNWSVQGSVAYSSNMGFHAYDAVQSGFSVSYGKSFGRTFREDGSEIKLRYPIRFTAGIQQEDFYNFTGGSNQQFRPFISLSIF